MVPEDGALPGSDAGSKGRCQGVQGGCVSGVHWVQVITGAGPQRAGEPWTPSVCDGSGLGLGQGVRLPVAPVRLSPNSKGPREVGVWTQWVPPGLWIYPQLINTCYLDPYNYLYS